jgi:hypothetical protein
VKRKPQGVNSIGTDAFANTKYLKSIIITDAVEYWGYSAFGSGEICSITDIYFDMEELPVNGHIPEDLVYNGRTIYVRNQQMRELVEEMLNEYYEDENWTISENYDW